MITGIISATVLVGVVGLFVGLFLGITGIKFRVKVDAREEKVLNALPGNNCGGCGYPGCSGLASAIIKGDAPVNACPVGGEPVGKKIGKIMGVEAEASTKMVAFVKCQGDCDNTRNDYEYYGIEDCRMLGFVPNGGPKSCNFGCLGYGSCVKVCPFDAIHVENGLATIIKENYPEVEVLMGTSTAGIAHAAITAHIMGLPMGYVRSGAKDHGRKNQIEGKLLPGQKVVVVEDLISTGGSVIEVVNILREAGAEVLGIVSIFTYGMKKGLERLAEANVKNVSLTNFDVISTIAAKQGYIKEEDVVRLLKFRDNPSDESWIG